METAADQLEAPTAIRTNLGAIFVSLELSRTSWLITSLSPANGEKMSKHTGKTGAYVTDAAAASDPILTQAQMLIEMRLKQIAQEQRLAAIEQRVEALPAPTTHLSVLAFANLNGIRLDNRLASVLGKHCAAQTRLNGGVIGAVADDHYGTVGNYPLPVLRQVFAAAGLISGESMH